MSAERLSSSISKSAVDSAYSSYQVDDFAAVVPPAEFYQQCLNRINHLQSFFFDLPDASVIADVVYHPTEKTENKRVPYQLKRLQQLHSKVDKPQSVVVDTRRNTY